MLYHGLYFQNDRIKIGMEIFMPPQGSEIDNRRQKVLPAARSCTPIGGGANWGDFNGETNKPSTHMMMRLFLRLLAIN
jgi:hypothetical protein